MSQETHPAVERLPLYKAVDSGRRTNEVVVELDYRPASPSEIIEAARTLEGAEVIEADITPAGCVEDYWNLDVDHLERQRARRWDEKGEYEPGRYLVIPIEGADQAVADARRTDPPTEEE